MNERVLVDLRAMIIHRVIANDYVLYVEEENFYDHWTENQYRGAIQACRCFFMFIDTIKELPGDFENDSITMVAAYIALYSFHINIDTEADTLEDWGKKYFLDNAGLVDTDPVEAHEIIDKYWPPDNDDPFAKGWLFTCSYIASQVVKNQATDPTNIMSIILNYFFHRIEDYMAYADETHEHALFWDMVGLYIRLEVGCLDEEHRETVSQWKTHIWNECGIRDGIIRKWKKRFKSFHDKYTAIQTIKTEQMCYYYD
ncbi:MAG: hypothetical protein LBS05_01665 [Tannerellaceae bacterium]|nr:hypothetical protein [Tannerellaceae bacterium]